VDVGPHRTVVNHDAFLHGLQEIRHEKSALSS
jgi:hypothetical protein